MIPAGYLYKKVAERPAWLNVPRVKDVHSLSGCISRNFADYIPFWRHNGYWLFDTPDVIRSIATGAGIDLSGQTLFYYEIHELEFDEDSGQWSAFEPTASFPTRVTPPEATTLQGFDVTAFSSHTTPECSPLSCNALSAGLGVNAHCLFETFADARQALESGAFANTEPGPFRIVGVYIVGARDDRSARD